MGKGTGQRQVAERNVHRRSAGKARDRRFPTVLGSCPSFPNRTRSDRGLATAALPDTGAGRGRRRHGSPDAPRGDRTDRRHRRNRNREGRGRGDPDRCRCAIRTSHSSTSGCPAGAARTRRARSRWRSPHTRIVALSAHRDERSVDNMLASGATSYLEKDSDLDDIMHAVTRSVDGDALLSEGVVQHVVSELGSRLAHEHGLEEDDRRSGTHQASHRRTRRPGDGVPADRRALVGQVMVGVEALARFPNRPKRAPDVWFKEATEVIWLGTELQVAAVELALAPLAVLPVDTFVSVNVDPNAAASPELADVLQRWPGERLVIELTEHAPASDYPRLREALDSFRRSGIRIAVDDAGAGFASLRHILELAPDIIKLDISIVHDIDTEASHRALASALVGFAPRDRHRTDRRRGRDGRGGLEFPLVGGPADPGLLHGPAGFDPRSLRRTVAERLPRLNATGPDANDRSGIRPDADLVEVTQQIGRLLVDAVRARALELVLAVPAGQQPDAQCARAPRRQQVPHAVADDDRRPRCRRPAAPRRPGTGRGPASRARPDRG